VVVPFIGGYDDVAGKTLKLNHITDPNLRPLDELFRDHFFQCVLGMKGEDELSWDREEEFDDEIDLSKDIWSENRVKNTWSMNCLADCTVFRSHMSWM